MNIALIAYGFTGSTLPLVKRFLEKGHSVSCFYIVNPGSNSLEALDFDTKYFFPGIYNLKSLVLEQYLNSKNCSASICVLIRKRKKFGNSFINTIIDRIDTRTIKKICVKVKNSHFDVVNIVGHMYPMDMIGGLLLKEKIKIVYSLHEIFLEHGSSSLELTTVTSFALKNKVPIIVHSMNSFHELKRCSKDIHDISIKLIHFGEFETYLLPFTFNSAKLNLHSYLFFFGSIQAYKGLSILYDAITILKEKGPLKFKIVVAGRGRDPVLEKMRESTDYILINRYLGNGELVSLIKKCKAIVCPYLSASQSGIPQTALVFRKPVIAFNVGAFSEIIESEKNGLLVDVINAKELAVAIEKMMCNDSFYEGLFLEDKAIHNSDVYDWEYICSQYEVYFKELIEE